MANVIISIKDYKDFISEGIVCILLKANGNKTSVKVAVAYDRMATKYQKHVKFGKIDVESFKEIIQYLKVGAIPEFIFYIDGTEITRKICTQEDELEKLIRKTADLDK